MLKSVKISHFFFYFIISGTLFAVFTMNLKNNLYNIKNKNHMFNKQNYILKWEK